jgi:flagellar biosynthetic protein FliO
MQALIVNFRKWVEGKSKKEIWVMALIAFSLFATSILLSLGSTSNVASDPLSTSPFYFLSAFVKLIVVLLLIVGCSIAFRRWLQVGPNSKSIKQMHLVETIRLSPKQALHLVTIGNQKLLIGATDQAIALIVPVENNLETVIVESQSQPGIDFGSMIRAFNYDYSPDSIKGKA